MPTRGLRWGAAGALLAAASLLLPALQAERPGADQLDSALSSRLDDRAQRQAWDRLARAQRSEKARLAAEFLERWPDSPVAPLAHFQLAVEAFDGGRYPIFIDHAEASLASFSKVEALSRDQVLRRFQLLSQLSFYYAEAGQADQARSHAGRLLGELSASRKPDVLSRLQWEQHRLQLEASAHYARGRAALARAVAEPQSAAFAGRLSEAERELGRTLELSPADGYAAFYLATTRELLGEADRASESYARAALLPGPAASPSRDEVKRLTKDLPTALENARTALERDLRERPRALLLGADTGPHPVFWWDAVPQAVTNAALSPPFRNIARADFAGPEACRDCHQDKYDAWRKHSHSRMNAWATPESVVGDFSGAARIRYQGGEASFTREREECVMKLVRGRLRRSYLVTRTLGSRFFQYYVGRQIEGPESREDRIWSEDHVLPFGYWISEQQWVPVVHINEEVPDEQRQDLFASPSRVRYDRSCSPCHTTRPFGDWLLTTDGRLRAGAFRPRDFSFDAWGYLERFHPELLPREARPADFSLADVRTLLSEKLDELPAKDYAVVLGVSCEACHNGALEHVQQSEKRVTRQPPLFFPAGPEVMVTGGGEEPARIWGRSAENLNWICSRCHSGGRPQFAAGIDTWNSTEYSDAARGACYSGRTPEGFGPLTCTVCHDPHHTIGKQWSRPPSVDDAKCLSCHPALADAEDRLEHTRHPAGSDGDRCLECHMPRLNEGLERAVRTHRIFSPTEASMIEANQPNACNLCHVDRSVEWTLGYLEKWYGKTYEGIAVSPEQLIRPATVVWLESSHEPTRLMAAEALAREDARWALPELVKMLDDPYLINRQFTQKRLEEMLGISLTEQFGYRFYQSRKERRGPLRAIRKSPVTASTTASAGTDP